MAGKEFHLEQVLKYRKEIERMRRHEFVAAKQDLEQAHEQLELEQAQIRDISQEFCQRQTELQSVEEMRWYADFFARKREDIKSQQERVSLLGDVMNQRRDVLLVATKDKKVLESLKEKKAEEFRLTMKLKEQDFMDEIAIQKKGKAS